jgi:DNA helicase II / ATP-dependent DNA helicase PcrA
VLYRMNAQSNQIEFAFKRSGIPYRVIGGTKFFDRAEIKDMLAYLCVISNPADEMRLMRVVNQPPRGIGQATLDTVAQLSETSGRSAFDIMANADMFEALSRPSARLRQFTGMIDELRELEKTLTLPELYDEVIRKTGYITMLESKKNDENTTRIENVNELKTNIITYMKENPDGNLAGFLDEISLYTDLDNLDRSQDCVSVMTMHSAKGLEFPTVFIIGAEEGVFPGARTIGEPDEMEEERRLCYVAMTRAKQRLFFTCARHRMLFGKTVSGQVSRFVDEIGSENINRPSENGFTFGGESELWDRTPDRGWGSRYGGNSSGGYDRQTQYYTRSKSYSERRPSVKKPVDVPKPAEKQAELVFAMGDKVNHKAFGSGVVTKVQPTGNDALIEVEFDKVGVKRLMMKSAASFMKKV